MEKKLGITLKKSEVGSILLIVPKEKEEWYFNEYTAPIAFSRPEISNEKGLFHLFINQSFESLTKEQREKALEETLSCYKSGDKFSIRINLENPQIIKETMSKLSDLTTKECFVLTS